MVIKKTFLCSILVTEKKIKDTMLDLLHHHCSQAELLEGNKALECDNGISFMFDKIITLKKHIHKLTSLKYCDHLKDVS